MAEVSLNMKFECIDDIMLHKKFLLDSCTKMAKYLMENNKENLALSLLKRAFEHDISKLSIPEFYGLSTFVRTKRKIQKVNGTFTAKQQRFLKIHWKNNGHHPEHWEDLNNMGELDIIEMVCDWHCRTVEYNTDLLEFVKSKQDTRFHFPDNIYNKVLHYCNIIVKL